MLRHVAVMVSGGGTNLQALIDARTRGEIENCEFVSVISSSPHAYALERATKAGISTFILDRTEYSEREAYDNALLALLAKINPDYIVLAGFMYVLGASVVQNFKRRIINVHPALIPSFCGDGYYGLRVHEAALNYGVKVTGATVHFVSEVTDGGEIILQKAVDILPDDTPEILQRRVMEQAEWQILPRALELLCSGEFDKNV